MTTAEAAHDAASPAMTVVREAFEASEAWKTARAFLMEGRAAAERAELRARRLEFLAPRRELAGRQMSLFA